MDHKINASPTKELFISLLTKDIGLVRAILDLIDNSVDAARQNSKTSNLHDYSIDLSISQKEFRITDNCGGMTLADAKEYAFKFGRDSRHPPSKHSIGRFGVGMKRTLFKLGKKIDVKSNAIEDTHPYVIQIDVNEWQKNPDSWEFEWKEVDKKLFNGVNGVFVSVTSLHENIRNEFAAESFVGDLISQIKLAHFVPISEGLVITVNGNRVPNDVSLVFYSHSKEGIKPQYIELDLCGVQTRIFCGLANRDKNKAGWYVFCNNRLIVEHNQDGLTGWGRELPKFHETYALFRGYIFFDSDDPAKLPWTSTKTNLDRESSIYQKAYSHIVRSTKPVLSFLKEMAAEKSWKSAEDRKDYLESEMEKNIPLVNFSKIEPSEKFVCQNPEAQPHKTQYSSLTVVRPKSFIDELREEFEFSSNKEFAEEIFKYYLKRNGVSDE